MPAKNYVRRKCDSCGEWIPAKPKFCPECGGYVDLRQKEVEDRELQQEAIKVVEKEVYDSKPWYMRVLIRIAHVFEVAFISIVSFFAWLIFWIGG